MPRVFTPSPLLAELRAAGVPWVDDSGALRTADGIQMDVGASATSLVTPQGVAAGSFKAPLTGGPAALPPSFFPKKRNLGIFTTSAACLLSQTGGATKTDDTSDPYVGNQSANTWPNNMGTSPLLTIGSGQAATLIPSSTPLSALDLTGYNVYVSFKVMPGGVVGPGSVTLGVRLYTGNTPNAAGANYLQCTRTNWNPTLRWQTLGFAIEDFTAVGTASLADIQAITHAGVRIGGISSTTQILQGQVFIAPKNLAKGAMVIAFDDCRADTWTDAAYEMIKYGFPGTLFPGAIAATLRANPDQFQMCVAQLQKLQRQHHWQVGSQAYTSEGTDTATYTVDQASGEMSAQRVLWNALGLTGGDIGSFFSQLGPNAQNWWDAFSKSFPAGVRGFNIGSSGAITAKSVLPETCPIADPNYITALGIDLNANTLADLTNFNSYVAASKGLGICVLHGVSAANATQFAKFTGWLADLDSRRGTVEVCTYSRALQQAYSFPF